MSEGTSRPCLRASSHLLQAGALPPATRRSAWPTPDFGVYGRGEYFAFGNPKYEDFSAAGNDVVRKQTS